MSLHVASMRRYQYACFQVALERKQEAIVLEQEGEEGMIHSILSGLPDLFEEGDEEAGLVLAANGDNKRDRDDQLKNFGVDDFVDQDQASNEPAAPPPPDSPLQEEGRSNSDGPINSVPKLDVDCDADPVTPSVGHRPRHQLGVDSSIKVLSEDTLTDEETTAAGSTTDETESTLQDGDDDEPEDSTSAVKLDDNEKFSESRPETPRQRSSRLSSHGASRPITPPAPKRPRVCLSHLLRTADGLYETHPPTHPDIALQNVMGPQSVMLTWSENAEDLPSDDEAEKMVRRPDLIVLALPTASDEDVKEAYSSSESEDEKHGEKKGGWRKWAKEKRRRRKLRKSLPLTIRRNTMVASAVLVLGVAVAVYGTGGFQRMGLGSERHGAAREWRAFRHFVGALVVGAAERVLDSVWG